MLRGFGIAILALGLGAGHALGQTDQQQSSTGDEAEGEAQPPSHAPPSLPIPTIPVEIVEGDAEADSRKRREEEASRREQLDLIAQQGMNSATQAMNEATQRMAKYSLWSTRIAAFGVLLLFGNLVLILFSNRVMRQVGKDQSRAYVHASEGYFFWGGANHESPSVKIVVSNAGATPAKWFKLRAQGVVYEYKNGVALTRPEFSGILPEKFQGPWAGLPPGGDGRSVTIALETRGEEIAKAKIQMEPPTHAFTIVGEVVYCSFFDEIFVSDFAFGRHNIPEYKIRSTNEHKINALSVTSNLEEPIVLPHFSMDFELRVYHRQ